MAAAPIAESTAAAPAPANTTANEVSSRALELQRKVEQLEKEKVFRLMCHMVCFATGEREVTDAVQTWQSVQLELSIAIAPLEDRLRDKERRWVLERQVIAVLYVSDQNFYSHQWRDVHIFATDTCAVDRISRNKMRNWMAS